MYQQKSNILKCKYDIIKLLCFLMVMFLTLSAPIYGQRTTRQITGVVNDDDGLPMPGVNVVEKGTTNGTITNTSGQYTIAVPNNNTVVLVFSFIGYQSQEIAISDLGTINVKLSEVSQQIEEVVVVGYGVQKKESIVGAIAQATEQELKRTGNVSDFRNALAGQIPGLATITSSGEPGGTGYGESATNLFIRGKATWNNANPLVLVDGVERDLSNIDVSEVASISVLKDASATAVFGVKGANGVILINSKRGQEGKLKLNANYTVTAQTLSKVPQTLDSYDTMMAKNEMIEREISVRPNSWNDIVPYDIVRQYRWPDLPEYRELYPNVNWQDAMFKKMGFTHKANLNIQGGNKTVRYFSSLSYLHEGDMIKHYNNYKNYKPTFDFDRLNFRTNVDVSLTSTTQLKVNFDGYYGVKRQNYGNSGQFDENRGSRPDTWMWRALYGMAPNMFPVQYSDGYWGVSVNAQNVPNPAAVIHNLGIQYQRTTQLNSVIQLEQDLKFITKGLSASALLSFDNTISTDGGIYDSGNAYRPTDSNIRYKSINLDYRNGPGAYTARYFQESTGDYTWTVVPWSIRQESSFSGDGYWGRSRIPVDRQLMYQFQLNYARNFNKHSVSGMGLFQRQELANGNDFKHFREDWVARATYDYDSRYLFEFNGAYNGSEQFGLGYRFAFFPSMAVGWYISNEKFFSGIEWIDRLKLRYSIGKVGNDRISNSRWLYSTQYSYGGMARLGYLIHISNTDTSPESIYTMYTMGVTGNPDLCWETAVKNNYGVELGVLKNLISLSFDYFTEERTGIMLAGTERTIPDYFGFPIPYGNAGHTKSKGFEIELGINKNFQQIHLWGKIFVAHNQNKIIFRDDAPLAPDYQKQAGYAVDQQRSVINSGTIYQNWDEVYASVPYDVADNEKLPGYYDLIDFNGDGKIDDADRAPVGYSEVPQNTANLSLGADYKGWSFMIQFYGVNNVSRTITLQNFRDNTDVLFDYVANYWSKDNPTGSYLPRWQTNRGNLGNFFQYDGSYLKLRAVELAYTFDKGEWLRKTGISNLKLFLQGNDLFFWSKMPEARETGGSSGAYPLLKRINLGIELSF